MDSELQNVTRPWLEPIAIGDLIGELRDAGYNIGVSQCIAVQDMILGMLAMGETFQEPYRLRGLLSPILCTSPSEQRAFPQHYDRWVQRLHPGKPKSVERDEKAKQFERELKNAERNSHRVRIWAVSTSLASAVIAAITAAVGASLFPPFLLLLGSISIAVAVLHQVPQAHLFLLRHSSDERRAPTISSIGASARELLPISCLFASVRRLRQRVEVLSRKLDIGQTVEATIHRAGWFTPIYKHMRVPAEYMVLVDRASFRDQQARLVRTMLDRLVENDVFVEIYYFNGDPRICLSDAEGQSARLLRDVAARGPEQRLVIFSDAARFFDPQTGELEPWTALFSSWSHRALLMPGMPEHWGYRERELANQFTVLPATLDGLSAFADFIANGRRYEASELSGRGDFPEELRTRPRYWTEDAAPPQASVDVMLHSLHDYLGHAGYFWLCACAVYQELSWDLTLYLGDTLHDEDRHKLLNLHVLSDLTRLPWFRTAYMPDWLRSRLIATLRLQQKHDVRAALRDLLITAVQGTPNSISLEIARQHEPFVSSLITPLLWLLSRRSEPSSPLRDRVFVDFMMSWEWHRLIRQILIRMLPWQERQSVRGRSTPHPLHTASSETPSLAPHTSWRDEALIRLLDIVGSLIILVLALPVMIVAGVLIKITSAGPVFYKQERVGQGGKLFTLYKFRTMIDNAEKHMGPVWASYDDDRVTPVGRVLRRMNLDELPQLFNILRGDMSLVGPRPERPFFVERHKALQGMRLVVKPGLTGLAQVRSYYDLRPAHKVKYDHWYVQNRSFFLNISILLQTIPLLFSRKRA
jgi:lipopolysaccharide/colanic/teichoic acid biosynthesis glycosyltransferase